MRVSVEWFILDNWAMDAAVLVLAGALSSLRPRWIIGSIACLVCAVYALIAVWLCPVLLYPPLRLALGAALALGLRFKGVGGYVRAVLSVYICAFLLGGLMIALSPGGSYGGTLVVGTLKTRVVLLTAPVIALMPRLLRRLRSQAVHGDNLLRVRVTSGGITRELTALIDTGNLLFEPVSGIPVMLICDWPDVENGLPVPYAGAVGNGEIKAQRAKLCELWIDGKWVAIDIMLAKSPMPISHAEAILPHAAMP